MCSVTFVAGVACNVFSDFTELESFFKELSLLKGALSL